MSPILQDIIPYLILYKYVAIFAIAFAAAFIIPIPSGSVLMAAAAFSSIGYFNIYLVIIISIIGNIAGDNLGYWIARRYGREVLSRIGFKRILKSDKLIKLESNFNKNPGFIVFISRFQVFTTLAINLLSGLSRTSYKKYLIYEVTGSISQVVFYGLIGYFFVNSWQSINTTIGKIALVIIAMLVILLISYGGKNGRKRKIADL